MGVRVIIVGERGYRSSHFVAVERGVRWKKKETLCSTKAPDYIGWTERKSVEAMCNFCQATASAGDARIVRSRDVI